LTVNRSFPLYLGLAGKVKMASLWGGASSPAARDKEMDEEEHLSGKARCSKLDDVVAALLGDGDSSNNDGNNDDADDDLLYQPVVFRSSSQRSHDQTAPPTVTQEQDYHPSVGECPGSSSQQEQQLGSCLSSSDSVKEKGQRLSLSESLVADKPLSAEALERGEHIWTVMDHFPWILLFPLCERELAVLWWRRLVMCCFFFFSPRKIPFDRTRRFHALPFSDFYRRHLRFSH
jgi:hypothetical protein